MSHIIGSYSTIDKDYGPEELKEKGSRFISYLYPIKTKEEADSIITGLRKKYHDSTHICFAYRLGSGEEDYFRTNDDGEPSGTAGIPIYNEIKSIEYFNILLAVIRYYGGTKLGTGGLTKAYGQVAKKVLDLSKRVTIHVKQKVTVFFPYDFTGEIMQIVDRFNISIVKQDYSAGGVHMLLEVPVTKWDDISKQVIDRSNGKIKLIL